MVGTERLERSIGDQPDLHDLLAIVDAELGNVFAFILRRCGDRAVPEVAAPSSPDRRTDR